MDTERINNKHKSYSTDISSTTISDQCLRRQGYPNPTNSQENNTTQPSTYHAVETTTAQYLLSPHRPIPQNRRPKPQNRSPATYSHSRFSHVQSKPRPRPNPTPGTNSHTSNKHPTRVLSIQQHPHTCTKVRGTSKEIPGQTTVGRSTRHRAPKVGQGQHHTVDTQPSHTQRRKANPPKSDLSLQTHTRPYPAGAQGTLRNTRR